MFYLFNLLNQIVACLQWLFWELILIGTPTAKSLVGLFHTYSMYETKKVQSNLIQHSVTAKFEIKSWEKVWHTVHTLPNFKGNSSIKPQDSNSCKGVSKINVAFGEVPKKMTNVLFLWPILCLLRPLNPMQPFLKHYQNMQKSSKKLVKK